VVQQETAAEASERSGNSILFIFVAALAGAHIRRRSAGLPLIRLL
jgi:hypothetical protein